MNREDLLYAVEEEMSYQKLIDVVSAIVALHKPFDDDITECSHCGDDYPCATIKVIEKTSE